MPEPGNDITSVPLSQREIEILRLVATGATNQQIAAQLDITLNTVKVHLRNIFTKIGVASRTEASLYAVRRGLVVIEEAAPVLATEPPDAVEQALAVADTPLAADTPGSMESEAASQTLTPLPTSVPAPATSVPPLTPTLAGATTLATVALPPAPAEAAPRQRIPLLLLIGAALVLLLIAGVAVVLLRPAAPPQVSPTVVATTVAPPNINAGPPLAPMSVPRTSFGLVEFDDRIYVIGGVTANGITGTCERYNPQSNTWTQLSAKPTPVRDMQVIALGGRLYVAGGQLADGSISNTFEVYDPIQDRWDSLPPLPAPRSQYAAATLDGKLYLFAGWDGTAYQNQVWMFDPDSRQWQTRTAMPEARGRMSAVIIGSRIHLVGGHDANGPVALHQSYDPAQDREGSQPWRVLPPIPQPLDRFTAVAAGDQIYTFDAASGALLVYNPAGEAWSASEPVLPVGSTDLAAVQMDTRVYVMGSGSSPTNTPFHLAYEVFYRVQIPLISR